ncbi:unnamed protein product [Ectocarpus sp. 13 AM-2016]
MLIAAGANLEKTYQSATPLQLAMGGGHLEVVRAMVKAGANVDRRHHSGATALSVAASDGRHCGVAAWCQREPLVDHAQFVAGRTSTRRSGCGSKRRTRCGGASDDWGAWDRRMRRCHHRRVGPVSGRHEQTYGRHGHIVGRRSG